MVRPLQSGSAAPQRSMLAVVSNEYWPSANPFTTNPVASITTSVTVAKIKPTSFSALRSAMVIP
jgi:hypothetical protein